MTIICLCICIVLGCVVIYILYNRDKLIEDSIAAGYEEAVKDIILRKWFWDSHNEMYVDIDVDVDNIGTFSGISKHDLRWIYKK